MKRKHFIHCVNCLLIFAFFSSISLCGSLYSQNQILDSLKTELKYTNGPARLTIYEKIVNYQMGTLDFVEAEKYAKLALNESEQMNSIYGLTGSLWNLNQICIYQGRVDEGLTYLYHALAFSENAKDTLGVAMSSYMIGHQYYNSSKIDSALIFFTRALFEYRSIGQKRREAKALLAIAAVYDELGDPLMAVKLDLEALAIYQELQNMDGILSTIYHIAAIYGNNKNYEKALLYYSIALKFSEKKGDIQSVISCLNNIGIILSREGKIEESKPYYYRALKLSNNINLPFEIGLSKGNWGGLLFDLNQIEEAIIFLNEADSILYRIKNVNQRLPVLLNLGNCYEKKGEYNKALEYYKESSHIADSLKLKKSMIRCYIHLADIYSLMNQPSQAYTYQKLYTELKDSIYNVETSSKIANMTSQYQLEKKDVELRELEKDKIIAQSRSDQQQSRILALVIGLIAIILIGILLANRRSLKHKAEIKTILAIEREKQTLLLVESVEAERMKIAQELHDSVGALLASTKLSVEGALLTNATEGIKESLDNTSQLIDQAATEVRIISHQMASKVLTYFGLIAAIKDLISHIPNNSGISFTFIHDEFTDPIKEKIEICLYRVTQEAISNIIKHSAASQVLIKLMKGKKGEVQLSISDNGKGYDYLQDFSGLGIEGMKTRVSILKGIYSVESSKKGTNIEVIIPLG